MGLIQPLEDKGFALPARTKVSYWDAEKVTFPDLPPYASPSDGSSIGRSLNGCEPLSSTGKGVHCMYLGYHSKECPVGYTLNHSTGVCDLSDLQACLDAKQNICDDDLPPDLAEYQGCDRPTLKQCGDGSYVRDDTGICPTYCSDYLSCYNFALNNSSCADVQFMEFYSGQVFSYHISCAFKQLNFLPLLALDTHCSYEDVNG